MISLNVQWIPVNDRSGTYQWSENDVNSRRVKTVTFFGTGEMRGQLAKAVTPPGSDYTDAYLSAFASKPIPTRHIHRLSTTIFDNSTPIPLKPTSTPLSISSSIKTSQTRSSNNDNIQPPDSFDRSVPSPSDRSSIYSSSFIPEISTAYKPFSNTQYSSPQSQTFTSSYSTLLHTPTPTITSVSTPSGDSQRSYTTFQTRSQPFSSTYTPAYRSETAYESIYKPMPAYSLQSYPPSNTYTTSLSSSSTESTYKPYVPFQSVPLSSSYDINQSSTSERTVLPTPTIAKPIDRPETLLFQHDEDLRSSRIEKPSPIFTPSPQSPMIREELKVQPELSPMEELPATTSEPIKILENTLSKYDSLINQISEVLASVSPLSSTVSSMSPGKSVLDYQLSSDTSPTLPHRRIESQTSAAKSADTQRTKQSHLIRDDSYDKIVTAISDLDKDMISPSDTQKSPSIIKEEETEIPSLDEPQLSSMTEEEKLKSDISSLAEAQTPLETAQEKEEDKTALIPQEETKILSSDEHQASSAVEEQAQEKQITPTEEQSSPSVTEEETKTSSFDEYQTSPVTEEEKKEETQTVSAVEGTKEETKASSFDEYQASPVTEDEKKEETQTVSAVEDTKEETKTSLVEEQQQVPSESKEEELKTSSIDEAQISSVTEEEKSEEPKHVPEDENQVPSSIREEKEEEAKTSTTNESQTQPIAEEEKKEEIPTVSLDESPATSSAEEKKEETITSSTNEDELSVKNEAENVESKSSLPEERQDSSLTEQENEETKIQSSDEHQPLSIVKEEKEETKIPLLNEQQAPSVSEESQNLSISTSSDASEGEIPLSSETNVNEEKLTNEQSTVETTEFIQQQTGVLTDVPSDVPITEELKEASVDVPSTRKTEKHVRWDETVVDNEDDESSSQQSPTEESSTPAVLITTTSEDNSTAADDLQTTTDQHLTSSNIIESQSTFEETDKSSTLVAPSNYPEDETKLLATTTEQVYQMNTIENESTPLDSTEQQIISPGPLETTTASFLDSTNQQITSPDITESQVSLDQRQTHSTSPPDTQSISPTDSSKEDTLTADEVSTTTSDVISSEDINKPVEEPETTKSELKEETKADISSQVVESALHESETVAIESTTAPLEPVVTSPIDTLADTVSNRYISSDVYHGYLGDHNQVLQELSDVDNDSTTKSLLASLRETITTPITPLIETIQSVVSSMQTTHPSKSDSDVTDQTEDATSLPVPIVTESTEEVSDDKMPIEEDKSIVDTSEKLKTVFENLQEVLTTPITAITETIQTAVSDLQPDKQEVSSTPDTEQLSTSLEENVSTIKPESSSNVVSPSDDDSNKEIEQTQPSLLESIQKKVSQTITTLSETIQNVVSTNVSSTEAHTEDEQIVQHEKSDAQSLEHSVPTDTTHDEISEESAPSKIQEPISANEKNTEFSAVIQQDEQVSAASPATLEQTDISDKQPTTISIESSSTAVSAEPTDLADKQDTATSEISSETSIEQKQDENVSTETKTTLEVIRDVITHPITTITEKIQSIIPGSTSEQVASDTTETSKEHQISETENAGTIEQISDSTAESSETTNASIIEEKSDSAVETEKIESTESKTTFESLRDAITHPIATLTEKIQSVISSSTPEEIPSAEKEIVTPVIDQNKDENITSIVTEWPSDTITNSSILVNETVEDAVSNTIDQTSSSQAKEQILTTQGSELYTEDQIHGEQEISLIATPSPISDQEKKEFALEQPTNVEIQDSVPYTTDDTTSSNANQLLVETIHALINDTINTVVFNLNQNTIENELSNEENITWNNLVGETSSDKELNQSQEPVKPALEEVIQSPDTITPQVEDVMQRSSNELESDSTSAITEIEKVPPKPSIEYRDLSPFNNEDDSFELINALQGHSIILPSSSLTQTLTTTNRPSLIEKSDEQNLQAPEKSSSSTTTSSQITSSDRYVSYAIHEMGDSSQERLPGFPLAADIPIYQLIKTTADENQEQQHHSEPIVSVNQNLTKDDDLTELDATENLTSYSDDVLIQKLHASAPNRQENLDASSTDEDVDDENFNEFEQPDVSNLHRIVEEATQHSPTISGEDGHTYQRYDLSSTSSTSTKPHTDDIYIIPGYPGLWKPSADDLDDDHTHSSFANDADDEDEKKQSTDTVKTRTIVRTTNPAKLQSFLQQSHDLTTQDIPLRPDTIDVFNRPLNEFSFDLSESESFKTCASTLNSSSASKQQQQQKNQSELFEKSPIDEHQISPDEKIFLIRERERGVSLPVTMKIDYDEMALRLSTSTPIDAQLYSTMQTDLPSPSTHSEPLQKTTSSSRASTPSLSGNESEQQKPSSSSWLNTVNTITTTNEGPDGPLESRTTIHKSSKGPISVAECDAQGKYIVIENTSRSKSIALASWILRQENDSGDLLTFTFPDNCLLRPNHSLKVLTKPNESERRNSDLIASSLSSWHTGSNVVTTLINADGKDRASLTKKTLFS